LNTIIKILIAGLIVYFIAWFLPGITVDSYMSAIWVALFISIVNITIKPFLELITFPLTILTLGISLLIINTLLILFVDYMINGFHVSSFFWALIFAVLVSIFGTSINIFGGEKDED
jgi:putative membrane protein